MWLSVLRLNSYLGILSKPFYYKMRCLQLGKDLFYRMDPLQRGTEQWMRAELAFTVGLSTVHKSDIAEEVQVSVGLGPGQILSFGKSGLTPLSGCYTSTIDLTARVMQVLSICFSATSHLIQPRWLSDEWTKEYLCNLFASLVITASNTRGNFLHCYS